MNVTLNRDKFFSMFADLTTLSSKVKKIIKNKYKNTSLTGVNLNSGRDRGA